MWRGWPPGPAATAAQGLAPRSDPRTEVVLGVRQRRGIERKRGTQEGRRESLQAGEGSEGPRL